MAKTDNKDHKDKEAKTNNKVRQIKEEWDKAAGVGIINLGIS